MSEFIQGGVLAVVSALLGYGAALVQAVLERRRRRAAVATALLTELQWQERSIRRLAEHDEAATSDAPLLTEVHDHFRDEFLVFKPKTISLLLELRGFVRDLDRTRQEANAADEVDRGTHGWARVKAGCAAEVMPQLRRRLEAEGGTVIPEVNRSDNIQGGVVTLPPPAF